MGLIKDLGVRQQLLANGVQMIICILFLKNETELKLHSSSIDPIMWVTPILSIMEKYETTIERHWWHAKNIWKI